jgi:hypothetical protein
MTNEILFRSGIFWNLIPKNADFKNALNLPIPRCCILLNACAKLLDLSAF